MAATLVDEEEDPEHISNEEMLLNKWDLPNNENDNVIAGAIQVMFCHTVNISNTENLFVHAKVNGHPCEVMIDNGATHNFITPAYAHQFGLKLQCIKDVAVKFVQASSTTAQIAMGVTVQASTWKGTVNFLVVPMDGFQVILGLEWADTYLICQFEKGLDKFLLDNSKGTRVMVDLQIRPKPRTNNHAR